VGQAILDEIDNADNIEKAVEQAENLRRGLWSATAIVDLVTTPPKDDAAKALRKVEAK
jgi:hypothetical protein